MTTLKLLISQQKPKTIELLYHFGFTTIAVFEQLRDIHESDFILAYKLNPRILDRDRKALSHVERQFYDYFSCKLRFMDIAESLGWPVLEHVFLIPMMPITELKPIIEEVRTRFPFKTCETPTKNGTLMRTNQQNLGAVKLCVSDMAGFELTKLRDITIERADSMIIGFRNDKEIRELMELCQEHLNKNKRKTGLKSLKKLFQRA